MPHLIERLWPGDPNAMGGRRDRRGFRYWAYVPDLVAEIEPTLGTPVIDELHRASEALGALQAGAGFPPLDALSRQLLRAESIGSSWIEGLTVSQRRVVQALYVPGAASETARAVAGNVEAMEAITGASNEATRKALNLLESAGVIALVEPARRHGRWWEAPDVLGLLDDFEWDVATPTQPDAPHRPAPRPGH